MERVTWMGAMEMTLKRLYQEVSDCLQVFFAKCYQVPFLV